jgi:methylthioribose-1-phosphate isomerase
MSAPAVRNSISAVSWVWREGQPVVRILDQRMLPIQTNYIDCLAPDVVMDAIRTLAVRGAPAIGIAAAYGIAQDLWQATAQGLDGDGWDERLGHTCDAFAATRPTAVNLFWAIARVRAAGVQSRGRPVHDRVAGLIALAEAIHADDIQCCLDIGRHGAPLMPDNGGVLTHCNTGSLATGGHGTALGVIRSARAMGKNLHVWIDETRPLLQGSRLTAWECATDGIPATLITDNMAGHVMGLGKVQAAVVGADRIALNGDSANKIGTYSVAILCKYHNIPFYIAAPTSTVDLSCPSGAQIPIEERDHHEVTQMGGRRVAATGTGVFNPAFDVAPAALIAGIITEEGVALPPFSADLTAMVERARLRRG